MFLGIQALLVTRNVTDHNNSGDSTPPIRRVP